MIQPRHNSDGFCHLDNYTQAWTIESGLRVSLAPGSYRVTGEERLNGIRYLCLDERFRLDVLELPDGTNS